MTLMKTISVRSLTFLVIPALLIASSCGSSQPSGEEIMERAFARHGGEYLKNLEVDFKFRDHKYKATLIDGEFTRQERLGLDGNSTSEKSYLTTTMGSGPLGLPTVNSVIHFALLPYNINDSMAHKELMCTSKIKGETYYKVEVAFHSNGGGEDFEDVYIYWVHKENFTIDYLAYGFYINGGGVRFREAYNQREVNGVRFQDYINYTIDTDFPAHELDLAFINGDLREISRIDLEDIEVVSK